MKVRKLNRDSNARVALFRGLLSSLFEHGEIKTTFAKASSVRGLAEKMISKAVKGSLHLRRQVQADLQDPTLVAKLFGEIAPLYKSQKGGFTKMTRVGNRRGDGATIVKLALTKKVEEAPKKEAKKLVSKKTAKKATPSKVVAPKAKLPTGAKKALGSSVGKVRKSGER